MVLNFIYTLEICVLVLSLVLLSMINTCPLNCDCSIKYVNCSYKCKEKVPIGDELGSTIDQLILSWNNITSLPEQVFWETRVTELRVIHLNKNNINYIDDKAFYGQKYLEYVDLSFNDISSISLNFFKWSYKIKWLSLAHNPLVVFDAAVINLESIDLSYCFMTKIPNIKAIDVNLENNNITKVGKVKLKYIDKVEKLKLSGNPFLCDCDFQDFMDLLETYNLCPSSKCSNSGDVTYNMLSRNCTVCPIGCECHYWGIATCSNSNLEEIPGKGFNTGVTTILLSKNKISRVKNDTFLEMNTTNVQYLSLSYNRISVIESFAFSGLSRLEFLDISFNSLTRLRDISFVPIPALARLSIAENKLSSVSIATVTNVKHLDLSNCGIRNFTEVAKYWGPSLTWLSLKENGISFLSKADLELMKLIKDIDISDNPLQCYVNLTDAYSWLKRKHLAKNTTCSLPRDRCGLYWQVLDTNSINQTFTIQPLTEVSSSSTAVIILSLTAGICFLVSLLLCFYIRRNRPRIQHSYVRDENISLRL